MTTDSRKIGIIQTNTFTFDDVEGAIEYISLNRSDIVLVTVDWWMPLMDGFRIIKLISDIDSDIKFLLISGYDLPEHLLRPNRNISYLKKPIRIAELIETVNKVLDSNKINIPNK